jgi:tetratricopeptide (TPR) repeat protein
VRRRADVEAIRALYEAGVRLSRSARPREAQRSLHRALRMIADADPGAELATLKARSLISLAYVEFELHGREAAADRLDAAAAVVDEAGLAELGVLLHMQRGLLSLRVGRLQEAVAAFDAADEHRAAAPASDRSILLFNRAVAHLELGDLASARRDLSACTDQARAADLPMLRVKATHNLGFVEFTAGNLPRALQMMDAAYAMDPSLAPGIAFLGKAEVLVEAGLLREADEALAVAITLFRAERLSRDLAEAELERARCALALGDPRAARRLAAAARDRFRGQGGDGWRRAAELVVLQADLAAGRRVGTITAPASRLAAEFAAEGLRLHARIAGLVAAEAALAGADLGAARTLFDGIEPPRRGDPVTGRLHHRYVSARIAAAEGRTDTARRRIGAALNDLAGYQARFGSIDLRTAAAVHGRRLAALDIRLALERGRPAAVFAAAERARAVASRLPRVRPPDDPVAADLLSDLRRLIESLRAVEQDPVASAPLLRRRRELERQIMARSWTRTGSGAALRPAPIAAVRARLADRGSTMVVYVQGEDGLAAVVVGRRARLHGLGPAAPVVEHVRRVRADLDVLAQPSLPEGIRAAVRASLHRSLRALDDALSVPLRIEGPLVLVSTGVLGQLPWASLPSLRGRPLVVAPSATKWWAASAASSGPPGATVALAGPGLGRGVDEVTAVAAAWPGARVHSAEEATTAALAAAMTSASVVHVAAHGVHQPANPLFSSVRMADGPVFAHELDAGNRAPDHVVLSACEVGLATIRPGDEALGLASVLLQLGTRSVIAGVARVGDELAEQTMVAYHAALAKGLDSSAALAEALNRTDGDVMAPFVNFGAAWTPNLEPTSSFA